MDEGEVCPEEYRGLLERLQSKLIKQAAQSGVAAKFKSLMWPFSEEKTQKIVETLRRYIGIFSQALSVDTLYDDLVILIVLFSNW